MVGTWEPLLSHHLGNWLTSNEREGTNFWIMRLLYPVHFNELCYPFFPVLVVSCRSSNKQKSISAKISWEAKRQVSWLAKMLFMTTKKSSVYFCFFGPHTPVRWRFKSKKRGGMPSSAGLDVYLNHRVGDQIPNDQSNQSDACSLSHCRAHHIPTPCSLVENMTKHTNLSADLSIKGDSFNFLAFLLFTWSRRNI